MEYIATFYSHFGALKYSRFLSSKSISCETMPVPRKLSSSCGVCVRFKTDLSINSMISEDIEKVFLLEGPDTKLIYDNE